MMISRTSQKTLNEVYSEAINCLNFMIILFFIFLKVLAHAHEHMVVKMNDDERNLQNLDGRLESSHNNHQYNKLRNGQPSVHGQPADEMLSQSFRFHEFIPMPSTLRARIAQHNFSQVHSLSMSAVLFILSFLVGRRSHYGDLTKHCAWVFGPWIFPLSLVFRRPRHPFWKRSRCTHYRCCSCAAEARY